MMNPQQQAAFFDQMQKSYMYAQQAFFTNGAMPHAMPPQMNQGGYDGPSTIQNNENINSERQNSKNSKNQ